MNLQMLKKAMLAYVSAVKFVWSAIAYPLSIVGKKLMNLRGYRVYGNSVQDGTPTPDSPIEIECVGDLSKKNLFDTQGWYDWLRTFTTVYVQKKVVDGVSCIYYRPSLTYDKQYMLGEFKENTQYIITWKAKGIVGQGESTGFVFNYTDGTRQVSAVKNEDKWDTYTFVSLPDKTLSWIDMGFNYGQGCYIDENSIQLEEGTTATEYEPYHKYKIPVVARGKNLIKLNTKSYSANGGTITNNQDGTYTLSGTPTGHCGLIIGSIPSSLLDVLRNNVCVLTGFYYYEKNVRITLNVKLNGSYIKYIYLNPYTYKNYVQVDLRTTEFDEITFGLSNQNNNVDFKNVTVKPLLEVGTTMPTSFEPYIAPITTNIFLDEPLRKVGDYADYVDFEKQKVVRNVEVLDDTGTKTIDESLGVINPPTEETVTLPALPQFKGTTIYEVGSSIKPSGIEAKYC